VIDLYKYSYQLKQKSNPLLEWMLLNLTDLMTSDYFIKALPDYIDPAFVETELITIFFRSLLYRVNYWFIYKI